MPAQNPFLRLDARDAPRASLILARAFQNDPLMNGTEFLAWLGKTHSSVKYVVVASHDEPVYVDATLTAGARGYVIKGDPDVLLRAIAKMLKTKIVVEIEP